MRRLDSFGNLKGAFQKDSEDLHALLESLADSKLRAKGLARAEEAVKKKVASYWQASGEN